MTRTVEVVEAKKSGNTSEVDSLRLLRQTICQRVDVLDMVVPDRDVVAGQLAETRQAAQRVEIVVED